MSKLSTEIEITKEMESIINRDYLVKGITVKEALRRIFKLAGLKVRQ